MGDAGCIRWQYRWESILVETALLHEHHHGWIGVGEVGLCVQFDDRERACLRYRARRTSSCSVWS